ncbi:hypothetical protein H696_03227 [Fonticula alba]|uniref:EGF-like domain-containing protein n=1 Tax=Fonticula alba TaxID=691883 RepID=A0A058Z8B4_FONAL|nr:hypothetical protein H696_03227 [Fonticula alba]KCV69782.1 hypothetical protein H696_03227 [Fonticula alba]|eukprot:XP_009495388.1 hypothetical protein H696_03227 [Fonticula alba]
MRCVPACPVGYNASGAGCSPCGEHCSSCPGQPDTCTLCERGWLLASPDCVAACPAGSSPLGGLCPTCHGSCATCYGPGPEHCLTCEASTPLLVGNHCYSDCPPGTFQREEACVPCSLSCAACTGPELDQCTACTGDRSLMEGICVPSCPAGHFSEDNVCHACDAACRTCEGPGACTSCKPGELLQPGGSCGTSCPGGWMGCPGAGECVACPEHCTACMADGPACKPLCTGCAAGRFLARVLFRSCPEHCTACMADGPACKPLCTGCAAGRFLADGACVLACPEGEYGAPGDAVCQPCGPSCRSCFESADRCTGCLGGVLDAATGTCLSACPARSAPFEGVCLVCSGGCERCEAAATQPGCTLDPAGSLACPEVLGCAACEPGLFLLGGASCVAECPAGTFPDQEASPWACAGCHAECKACLGPEKADCLDASGPRSSRIGLAVGLAVGLLLLLILLILLVLFCVRRRTKAGPAAPKDLDAEDATMLNTIVELALPGAILVGVDTDFRPLDETLGAGTQASPLAAGAWPLSDGLDLHVEALSIDGPAVGWALDMTHKQVSFYGEVADVNAADEPRLGVHFSSSGLMASFAWTGPAPDRWLAVPTPSAVPLLLAIFPDGIQVVGPGQFSPYSPGAGFSTLAALLHGTELRVVVAAPDGTLSLVTLGPGSPSAVELGPRDGLLAPRAVRFLDATAMTQSAVIDIQAAAAGVLAMAHVRLTVRSPTGSSNEALAVLLDNGILCVCIGWQGALCTGGHVQEELPFTLTPGSDVRFLNPPGLVSDLAPEHLFLFDGTDSLWAIEVLPSAQGPDNSRLDITPLLVPGAAGDLASLRMVPLNWGPPQHLSLKMVTARRLLLNQEDFKCGTDPSIACSSRGDAELQHGLGWACASGRVLAPNHPSGALCAGCSDGLTTELTSTTTVSCVACGMPDCRVCSLSGCLVCAPGFLLAHGTCVSQCPPPSTRAGDRCLGPGPEQPLALAATRSPVTVDGMPLQQAIGPIARTHMRPGPDGQVVITAGSLALRQWLLLVPSAGATPARLATLQPTGELLVDQSPGLALPVAQLHSYLELGPMVADGVTWLFGVGCSQAGVLTITRFECRLPSSSDSQAASQSTSHEGEPHCVVSIGPPEPLLSGGSSVCRVLAPLGDRGQMASIQMHDSQDRISIYTITLNPLVPAGYRVSMLLHGTSPPAIFPLPASWSSPGDPWLLEAGGTGTALNPLRLRHSVDPRAMLPWEHSAPGPGLDPAQFATHRRPVVLPTPGRGPDHPNEVLLSGVYPGPGHLVWDAQHIPLGSHAHARTRDLPTYVTLLGAIPGAGVPGPGPEYALLGVELPEQADHPAALVLVTSSHLAIARLHCPADLAPECFLLRATVQALGPGVGPLAGPQHAVAVALPAPGPGAGALSPGARAGDGPADPPAVGFLLAGVGLDGPLLVTLGAVECSPGEYGPACEPCDAACAECTGPGPDACVACFLSLPDDPGACVAECPTGTVPGPGGGVCVCAAAGCSGCQGTGPAGAYECSACAVGFAPDPLPGVACSPCHHACDGCSKPDSPFFCHACAGAFFLVPDGGGCQADCPDGTWKNPANHRCSRCIDNCQRCTSADVCEACYPRAILAPDQRACRACHPSCLTCTPDGSCDTCQPGLVFLEPDGPGGSLCGNVCPPGEHVGTDRCMACHGACALCSGPGSTQCQVCAAGYRWAGLAPRPGAAGECVACPPGCASCDMSDRCLSCLAGYFLAPGATCGQACPAGHFADLADGSCQACDISCATCTGPDADQCDSCPPGLGLAPVVAGLAGACVSGCPAGHYRDPVSGGCAPCDAACAACNGPSDQDCWSCPPGLADVLQDGACVLACAGGHVAVARRCLPCHGTCRECTGTRSTDCTDCPSHLLALPMGAPSAGRCVAGCPVGYHWQPGGCARCADQCSSCPASPTACTLCDRGWLLQGPGCVSQCSRGLLPLNGQCTVCHGTCGTCFGPAADQCASCPEGSGLRLHGGACVAACPAGTFTEAATCLPCDGTCAECAGPGAQGCTACPPGRVLATWGACLEACPAGEYATGGGLPGPGAGTCRACDGSCARCTGPGWQECTACRGGDFLHAGACLAACPGGLFGCPGTGGCSACPEHCAACRPASGPPGGPPCQAECTACAPGFHLSPGASSCVEACPPGEFLPAGGQACQTCDPACASCVERADNCTACARPGAWLDLGSGMCSGACAGGGVAPVDFGPAALPQRVCLPCPLNCEACPVGGPAGGGGGGGGLPPCELAASGRLVCPPITGCARCQAGMRLMPEGPASPAQCLSVCPARYFPAAAASGEVCTPCHASCERCAGPTADDCIGSPGRSPRRDLAMRPPPY